MMQDKSFIDAAGKLVQVVTDPDSGMAFIIGSLKGETQIAPYFEDMPAPDRRLSITAAGALKLSDALKKAAYHGK